MFEYFYNEILRRTIISFGTLFNNISIKHEDSSDNVVSVVKVPLAYGPTQKFLARMEQSPDLNKPFAITLPRMSFEFTGLTYDPSRKVSTTQTFTVKDPNDGTETKKSYMPVPYNMQFELSVMTKLNDDALQIVEQILPYFQPEYTVTMNVIPELDIKRDIPIILNSVNYEDTYNGEFTQRRAVIYTLSFTAKTYLYGPMSKQGVIKTVQSDLGTDTDSPLTREERIVITPKPTSADADDDFGFTTTITSFTDSKRYNPTSGSDT